MNLSLFIAKRYFFSKKSQRAINVISLISVIAIVIGTGALIIVLSAFNGFEKLVVSLYNSFDPDIKVTLNEGKTFDLNSVPLSTLKKIDGIKAITYVLEENALVKYRDKQDIVTIKGVSKEFQQTSGLDTMIADGQFLLQRGDTDYAVVGGAIAYNLKMNLGDFFSQVEVYAPRRNASSLNNPEESFNRRYISPSGIFAVQQEFDAKYIIVPLRFTQEIFEYDSSLSALEIAVLPGTDIEKVITQIKSSLGEKFVVQDRFRQHAIIYRIMKSERWAVFLILAFILLIATFNVIGSLTMLIIEKQHDIAVLHSMGADVSFLRKVFLTEGLFITFIGAVTGLIVGGIICFLQLRYGIVKLSGSGSFVIDAYPMHIQPFDFLYVFITVFGIGLLAAWYPAKKLVEKKISLQAVSKDE
jgi:lipoprotein-releasing system permease protein